MSDEGGVVSLPDAIVEAVKDLPVRHAFEIADDIAGIESAGAQAAAVLSHRYPHPSLRDAVEDLVLSWRAASDELPGSAVALALRAAASARGDARAGQRIDPVWSGPETSEIAVRRTRQALIDVVRAARQRLIVVAFAAYKAEAVVEELLAAARRDVDVRLVLETTEDSAGYLSHDASGALTDLRGPRVFLGLAWRSPAAAREAPSESGDRRSLAGAGRQREPHRRSPRATAWS